MRAVNWLTLLPPPSEKSQIVFLHAPSWQIILIYSHFLECLLSFLIPACLIFTQRLVWFDSCPSWLISLFGPSLGNLGLFYAVLGWRCIIVVVDNTLAWGELWSAQSLQNHIFWPLYYACFLGSQRSHFRCFRQGNGWNSDSPFAGFGGLKLNSLCFVTISVDYDW
jgi:hypothetical protein